MGTVEDGTAAVAGRAGGLLAGRRALVTGAARGIGRAVASRFVAEGATVAGVDRQAADVAGVHMLEYDLADIGGLGGLVGRAEAAIGPLDVLVNVAGISRPCDALELSLDLYRLTLAVNLDAPVLLAVACARGMVARGYGRIVNVTSIHAQFGEARSLAYDVSKAGLAGCTRTLAVELSRHGVLVNAIAPGFVRTDMSIVDGVDELQSDWFRRIYQGHGKLPLGRAAEPPEIAGLAAWLASEDNTYVTGQSIAADGGLSVTF
jgi:NAD(P)-dependent dehydrogenase (short-subunit alcohol dehydrogenase family)